MVHIVLSRYNLSRCGASSSRLMRATDTAACEASAWKAPPRRASTRELIRLRSAGRNAAPTASVSPGRSSSPWSAAQTRRGLGGACAVGTACRARCDGCAFCEPPSPHSMHRHLCSTQVFLRDGKAFGDVLGRKNWHQQVDYSLTLDGIRKSMLRHSKVLAKSI